jgi:signal transduction histidine kinase
VNPYLLLPLFAAVCCTALASGMLIIGVRQLPNRVAGALLLTTGYWALLQVLWNAAWDPRQVLWLQRASAPGWVFLGPLILHLAVAVSGHEVHRLLRRLVPVTYAAAGVCLALAVSTPWMLGEPVRRDWGFSVTPGPGLPFWLLGSVISVALALAIWAHDRSVQGAAHRHPRRPWGLLMAAALFAVVFAERALPLADLHPPPVGALALTLIGARAFWYLERFGYSRLSPAGFANRVLRTLPDGVALVHLSGRIRLANERMAALIGCSLARTEGLAISDHLDPELLTPPRELRDVESELRPLSGRPIPVSISTAVLLDNRASVLGMVLIVRDQREMAMLRDRLATSDRMVAVGQLAAGIAHEINNPLAYVRANLHHMRREWSRARGEVPFDAQRAREWEELLGETLEGVDRAATIIRDVKAISHSGDAQMIPADLNELLDQVMRLASPQFKERIRVETSYGRVPPLPCSPQRLQQLFLNLVVNAAQSIDGEGLIRVTTQRSGETLIATVEDSGCGIAPDLAERIFDPFFTTKGVGEGSGLGLSISYEIVRAHAGEIWVDSEPGRGSAFHVRLPLGMSGADA